MKTIFVLFYLLVLLELSLAVVLPYWRNEITKPLDFTCPNNQIISYLNSIHDNRFQDRVWEISCRSVRSTTGCYKTDWVNEYDNSILFHCHENRVLTGIQSRFDSTKQDRQYKFTCCFLNNVSSNICESTPFLNEFDGPLTLNVREGYGIVSVYSYNSDLYSDRRFGFKICRGLSQSFS